MTTDYRMIADDLAEAIKAGRMKPGEKLLPQREFAYQHHVAASTAGRVYGELRRRGLVSGEVGRGTFVKRSPSPSNAALLDIRESTVNLELVYPLLDDHRPILSAAVADLAASPAFVDALAPIGATPSPAARNIAARFLSQQGWSPQPSQILFAGNGKQAIAAALSALAPPGSRIGIEALTYPVVKYLASQLRIELVPIDIDDQGMSARALDKVLARGRLAAVYVQPSIHNPTAATMSVERRKAVADVLKARGVTAIEDGVYRFLVDEIPLAAFAPNYVILIDSLSKRLAAGLGLGLIACPDRLVRDLASSIRRGVWMPVGLPLANGLHWMASDTLPEFVAQKRRDAQLRQRIARSALKALNPAGDERAYHLWLRLPDHWRAESFVAAALRRGIALTPGSAFAAQSGHAPNCVRVALASPAPPVLRRALEDVAELASTAEEIELE
jgi:DNA-binding transcriptional MocR family regulator